MGFNCSGDRCCARWAELGAALTEGRTEEVVREVRRLVAADAQRDPEANQVLSCRFRRPFVNRLVSEGLL